MGMKVSVRNEDTRIWFWVPGWLAYGRVTMGIVAMALKHHTGRRLDAGQRQRLRRALRDARDQLAGRPLVDIQTKDKHERVYITL